MLSSAYCQPKIAVVGGNEIDAGTVYNAGQHIIRTFQLENTGDQPLRINNVRTSCGCTAALLSDSVINPGAKSEIKVDFNPAGYNGQVTKHIYVLSNDPQNQMITLDLIMNVTYALRSEPNFVLFSTPIVGIADTSAVALVNESDEVIRITGVETNAREISSNLENHKLEPHAKTILKLFLTGEKPGPLYGDIIVRTSSKLQPSLALRYYAGVREK